VFSVALLQEN